MKVLMFGWEFPPFHSGGLGTACYGLTKALYRKGVDITFIVPYLAEDLEVGFIRLVAVNAGTSTFPAITSLLSGYASPEEYGNEQGKRAGSLYGRNLFAEVERYAQQAARIAAATEHDLIHAHDWMTFPAGLAAKKVSGKPLVVQVHATEFDRTGGQSVHQEVYNIEKEGMVQADAVITVSNFTKEKVVHHYGISPGKITVIHNAVEGKEEIVPDKKEMNWKSGLNQQERVVLFLGRVTLQKGPDYFLAAAKKVLEYEKNITFVFAGDGDMLPFIMRQTAESGLAEKVLFTGFLRGSNVDLAYNLADVYVMPSVSEPFGLTPLEALRHNVPAIISKQSGVSEVLFHCLKVDFWDVQELANKIIAVLQYPELQDSLRKNGAREVSQFSWSKPAQQCQELYERL